MPRARSSEVGRPDRGSIRGPHGFFVLLAFAVAVLVHPVAGGSDLQLSSGWRGEPIRIDGNNEEWSGRMVPVEKQKFSVGLQNDGEALYLCLITRDRVLGTQVARQGLMVWLDPGPERPKKHVFGVHFPIDPRLAAERDPGGRWPRDGAIASERDQTAVGILGPDKRGPTRVPIPLAGGILAAMAFRGEVLIYELKVPLKGATETPYAVAVRPGDIVRLELQTPEWRGPLPPSRGPVGVSAAASSPGGRGVVGYPSVDASYLKQTDVKAVVRLASGR
jgi:hypothetical protein